jgi:transcriptional regulator with XRE-family HTH domain
MIKEKGAKVYTSKTTKRILGKLTLKERKRTEQKMLLAAKIADAMESKGWSRSEFAGRLNRHPSEVTKWLSGIHNFTGDTLFDIQEELGIKLLELESLPNNAKGQESYRPKKSTAEKKR